MNNEINKRPGGASAERKKLDYIKAKSEAEKRRAMLEAEKNKQFGKSLNPFNRESRPAQPQFREAPSSRHIVKSNEGAAHLQGQPNGAVQRQKPPSFDVRNPKEIERRMQNARAASKAEELRRQLGRRADPKKKIELGRSGQSHSESVIGIKKPTTSVPKRPDQSGGWVIPDNSPNYQKETPKQQINNNRTEPKHRGERVEAQSKNSAPSKKSRESIRKEKTARIVGGFTKFCLLFLAFLIIFSVFSFWRFRAVYYSQQDKPHDVTYTYIDAEENSTKSKTHSALAFKSGVQYINFTELSKLFDMSKVGSINNVRFIITDNESSTEKTGREQTVNFYADKKIAVVNGTNIVLENLCKIEGDDVWVPLSFATNYIDGVKIETDKKGNATFTMETGEENTGVSFRVSSTSPINLIDYDKVD